MLRHSRPSVNTSGGATDKFATRVTVSRQCALFLERRPAARRGRRIRTSLACEAAVAASGSKLFKHHPHRLPIIANRQHVTARSEGEPCALHHIAERGGAGHAQIVGEYASVKTQRPAQDIGDPAARQAGRQGIDRRIHDVGRHDARQLVLNEQAIGP